MTAGRREFVGKNRTAAGEIPIYIGMVKIGKKNLPFRRTPESLQEIPIYIGMVKIGKKNLPFRRTPESLQEIPIYIGMVKIGKKNLPFRRTPESLQEIPIYIGMVKNDGGNDSVSLRNNSGTVLPFLQAVLQSGGVQIAGGEEFFGGAVFYEFVGDADLQ